MKRTGRMQKLSETTYELEKFGGKMNICSWIPVVIAILEIIREHLQKK